MEIHDLGATLAALKQSVCSAKDLNDPWSRFHDEFAVRLAPIHPGELRPNKRLDQTFAATRRCSTTSAPTPTPTPGSDTKPAGCEGKIDLLFVISRDASMKSSQEKLLAAFPGFIATIQAKFADFDFHIMVVDGDTEWGLITCDNDCAHEGLLRRGPGLPLRSASPRHRLRSHHRRRQRLRRRWVRHQQAVPDRGRAALLDQGAAEPHRDLLLRRQAGHSGYDLMGQALTRR
jgi:hypothetical protein